MRELIEEILLNSEESSLVFIADAEVIGDVALNLLEDGVPFVEAGVEEIEELMEANYILAIAKNIYEDGTVDYFIEPVFNKDGETLEDDSDIVFIDSDLVDCVDRSKFHGDVIAVKSTKEDTDDEDYEKEIEEDDDLEDLFEEFVEEIFEDIMENQDNEDFCLHCAIKDRIREAYEIGYKDCQLDNEIK